MTDFLPLVPLIGLYAETHYRFRFFPFSLYYRREPEIIFDAPFRIEPGSALPVTLLIKDAYQFPIELEEVTILVSTGSAQLPLFRFPINRPLDCRFYHQIFDLNVSSLPPGQISVIPTLTYRLKGKQRRAVVDNHPGLSHRPLTVRKAADPLPLAPGWIAGELHCHTSYGPDQVEFSAPLEVIKHNAAAMGLHFSALTDHSYDLDDLPDDYLHPDPDLVKWELLQDESARLNRQGGPILLPGEELSCRNSKGQNIHLLILGNRQFISGSGDSAEKWLHTRSEYSVAEALKLVSPDAFVAAAHPLVPTPWLEKLLIRRGEWQEDDLMLERLDGWQIANGSWGVDFQRGFNLWRKTAPSTKQIRIYGGNDAHGNFNRFRQVRIPMLTLHENDCNLFGRFTTRIKTAERTQEGILRALKSAPCQISDGPSLDVIYTADNEFATIKWYSSEEFGCGNEIRIHNTSSQAEKPPEIVPLPRNSYSGEILKIKLRGSSPVVELIVKTPDGQTHRSILNHPDPN